MRPIDTFAIVALVRLAVAAATTISTFGPFLAMTLRDRRMRPVHTFPVVALTCLAVVAAMAARTFWQMIVGSFGLLYAEHGQ